MHYLIVFPYYFFTALTLSLLLSIVTRVLRLRIAIGTLVTTAVLVSLGGYIAALASDGISIEHFTGLPMLAVGLTSFLLAAVDTVLKRALPHAIDEELQAEH